jgi:hypothetical protein
MIEFVSEVFISPTISLFAHGCEYSSTGAAAVTTIIEL